MKLLIINNLASGLGEGAIHDFTRSFAADGDEICIRSYSGGGNVARLLSDASSFDVIVPSGGDGTIAAVCYELRYSGIPVLPFPAGTANLLTLNLASPIEPHALSIMARSGKTLDFDMGEIEVGDKNFGFNLIAGAGYDATIMHGAKPAKKLLGPIAYFSAALANPLPQKSQLSITLDGETFESEGLGILIINFSKIQFDISVTHENHPRDGVFDIVILKAQTAFELIPAVIAGILDRGGEFPNRGDTLDMHQGKDIRVVCDPPMEVQFDGETTGLSTPFHARVLQGATRLIVSEEGYELFS